jgi:hypothetical protein
VPVHARCCFKLWGCLQLFSLRKNKNIFVSIFKHLYKWFWRTGSWRCSCGSEGNCIYSFNGSFARKYSHFNRATPCSVVLLLLLESGRPCHSLLTFPLSLLPQKLGYQGLPTRFLSGFLCFTEGLRGLNRE